MNTIASTPPVINADMPVNHADVAVWSLGTGDCTVHVLPHSHLIDPEIWKSAFSGCKDYRYFEIVEESLYGQFDQKYFVIRNDRTGETAVQPFFFVNQDLLAGLPARLKGMLASVRRFRPGFLNLKMMMIGCAEGDGQLHREEPWAVDTLRRAALEYAKHEKAVMIILKAFPAEYRAALAPFSDNGYRRVPSMPGGRMEIDFKSFDEYMQTKLSRIFRKNLRRKFKKSDQLTGLTMEVVNDATPCVDEIYGLYLQTYERSEFKFEKLTKGFLCALGRRIPERTRFFIWRHEGRIIAFALCLVHEGIIYDLNVGMDYAVALDLHLYFVTYRDIIQWAAENGMKKYYTGPLNYDPKLHLRLDLDPLDLYARHTSDWINPVFNIALKYLQPARHDPYIPQFRNAGDLY